MNNFAWMITTSTNNIGDDFQCIAAKYFLPKNADKIMIDREQMNTYSGKKVNLIANGWYMHHPENWPPSKDISPLLTSIHISNVRQRNGKIPMNYMFSKDSIEYMKKHSPIGCRDIFTYKMLQKKGIPSYFSGCMTLTLRTRRTQRKDYICLVDPSKELEDFVKEKTKREVVIVRPEKKDWPVDYKQRIGEAEKILQVYANAHMVITGRLHGALPSLAMGTPVLLLTGKFGDERYEGLKYFLNYAVLSDLYQGKYPIDFENPMENPQEYLVVKNNLEKIVISYIKGNKSKLDFEKIHDENIEAMNRAKKRTIDFYRKNNLYSIKVHEFMSNIRYKCRTIENKFNL